MASHPTPGEARVAVLVDCDNVSPDVLEHALFDRRSSDDSSGI